MPYKVFKLDDQLLLTIYKRKASRNLRLSISPDGKISVSIPSWAPYSSGLQFARSRQSWIESQHNPIRHLMSGQAIGKAHHLRFIPISTVDKVSSRVSETEIVIKHPITLNYSNKAVQMSAEKSSIRALRTQAEHLLPQRLASLANQYGFEYSSVSIKQLKSRWGSCDAKGHIVLNLFLMQLPWEFIDYVLLHELMHTRIMRHGPDFWEAMKDLAPRVKETRKALLNYHPVLLRPD